MVSLEQLVLKAMLVTQDLLVWLVHQDQQVHKDLVGPWVHQEPLVM